MFEPLEVGAKDEFKNERAVHGRRHERVHHRRRSSWTANAYVDDS